MNKKYTEEEHEFLTKNYPTMGFKFCQAQLNIPNNKLKSKIIRMGLKLTKEAKSNAYKGLNLKTDPNKYSVNPTQFFNIKTSEVAYVLGLLWADGYILKNNKQNSIRLGVIKEDFDYFITILNKLGEWRIYHRIIKNKKPQGHAEISNRLLVDFLFENDYKSKSHESACKILSKIPEHLKSYWFLGLMDGDGCFYITKKKNRYFISICSSIGQDWTYIENVLKNMNISYRIIRRSSNKGNSSICQITSRQGILDFGNWIYKSEMGLPRKRQKFNLIKESIEGRWKKFEENRGIYYRDKKDKYEVYYIDPANIKSKKYIGSTKIKEEAKIMRDNYKNIII